jgi:hypothetical protein
LGNYAFNFRHKFKNSYSEKEKVFWGEIGEYSQNMVFVELAFPIILQAGV